MALRDVAAVVVRIKGLVVARIRALMHVRSTCRNRIILRSVDVRSSASLEESLQFMGTCDRRFTSKYLLRCSRDVLIRACHMGSGRCWFVSTCRGGLRMVTLPGKACGKVIPVPDTKHRRTQCPIPANLPYDLRMILPWLPGCTCPGEVCVSA